MLVIPKDEITYPRLRELKGKHKLTNETLSNVIGMSAPSSFLSKIEKCKFSFDEIVALTNYFIGLGEDVSVQSLFFDWKFTVVK